MKVRSRRLGGKKSKKEQAIGKPGEYHVLEASKQEGRSGGPKAAKIASKGGLKIDRCAYSMYLHKRSKSVHIIPSGSLAEERREIRQGLQRDRRSRESFVVLWFCVFVFLGGKDLKMFKTFWEGSS